MDRNNFSILRSCQKVISIFFSHRLRTPRLRPIPAWCRNRTKNGSAENRTGCNVRPLSKFYTSINNRQLFFSDADKQRNNFFLNSFCHGGVKSFFWSLLGRDSDQWLQLNCLRLLSPTKSPYNSWVKGVIFNSNLMSWCYSYVNC